MRWCGNCGEEDIIEGKIWCIEPLKRGVSETWALLEEFGGRLYNLTWGTMVKKSASHPLRCHSTQRTWSYLNHTLGDKVKRCGDSKPEAKVQEVLASLAPLPAQDPKDQSLGTSVGTSVPVNRSVWWKASGAQSYYHWCTYFSGSSGTSTTTWGLEQPLNAPPHPGSKPTPV